MSSCKSATLIGIDGRCDTSTGGIKRVLIAQKDDIADITVAEEDNPEKLITKITLAGATKFQQWLFRKQTGSFSTSIAIDDAIGTAACTTELNLQFTKAEAAKRLAIQSAINADAVILVEDMFGQYILLGKDQGVTVTSANMTSGTAVSDLNGFQLTLTDISTELPYFVDTDKVDIDSLIAD